MGAISQGCHLLTEVGPIRFGAMGTRSVALQSRFARLAVAGLAVAGLGLGGCSDDKEAAPATSSTTTATTTSADRPTTPGGEFLAVSYNVAGLPAEISKEHPDVNIPLISPLLEQFDLVLTQEDFDWWGELAGGFDFVNYHSRLRADVTHQYQSSRHPGPDAVGLDLSLRPAPEVGDGLGLLSRFPITERSRVPWVECFGGMDTSDRGAGDCLAMKGFSLTEVELADGVVVHVYNLHGEAGGSDTDQALQAKDYRQLAEYIAANSEGHAIVLGGDTNLHTDSEHEDGSDGADTAIWADFLEATGLTDVCTSVGCDEPGRIDKFAFRSGGGVNLKALTHRFRTDFVDDAGQDLSDHQALEVKFSWTGEG